MRYDMMRPFLNFGLVSFSFCHLGAYLNFQTKLQFPVHGISGVLVNDGPLKATQRKFTLIQFWATQRAPPIFKQNNTDYIVEPLGRPTTILKQNNRERRFKCKTQSPRSRNLYCSCFAREILTAKVSLAKDLKTMFFTINLIGKHLHPIKHWNTSLIK